MEYMVVYSSKTGNTKKIATEIFSALPGMSRDIFYWLLGEPGNLRYLCD